MALHPQARQFLDTVEASGLPKLPELSPADARLQALELNEIIGRGPEVAEVADFTIATSAGEIAARRYVPDGPLATILWVHGGGFVICDLDTHDAMCRALANASGCRVIAIDYRLAPEHPFPAPIDDCWDALRWVAEQHSNAPLIVGGDSAGGNLTAVLTQRARDHGGPPIALQVLVYPATDFGMTDSPSYRDYGSGPDTFLTADEMEWFADHYTPDPGVRETPEASPLRAESLANLPPAILVTAECDPLRDQGIAYGERLRAEGVSVTHHQYEGQIHAFFGFVNIFESADEAVARVGADIRAAVAAEPASI